MVTNSRRCQLQFPMEHWKMLLLEEILITVIFAITNTHSQGKWIIEIEDNVEIDDAQSVKEEEFVIANDAIFGPTPFLMKSDLGTKRATDVDIKITKKQFSGWKYKSRKKMQDNYNKKLKKK